MPLLAIETDVIEEGSEEQSTVEPIPPGPDTGGEEASEVPMSTAGEVTPVPGDSDFEDHVDDAGEGDYYGMGEDETGEDLPEDEQKRYNELMLKIQTQNRVVNEIKAEIQKRMAKCPRTRCEEREIGILKICMEQENLKLQCFLKELICMQQEYPKHKWPQIPLATTYDDDCMPLNYQQHIKPKPTSDSNLLSRFARNGDGSGDDSCQKLFQKNGKNSSSCDTEAPSEVASSRDQMIECLQQQIAKLCQKRDKNTDCNRRSKKSGGNEMNNLSRTLDQIQVEFQKLKVDVETVKRDRAKSRRADFGAGARAGPKAEQEDLRQKYCDLLEEFAKKDKEFVDMKKRMRAFAEDRSGQEPNDVETKLLREQIAEMMEEQDEYKVLICEQSKQIEDYREKYLRAQQLVEEQKCLLKRQDLDNKKIEAQVNAEMQRIKDQFEKKLQEYAQLPKLLENEQLKLSKCCKEKQELETKLCIVCRELKSSKQTRAGPTGAVECENCRLLEKELENCKMQNDTLNDANKRLIERNQQTTKELDCLRCESAKIIARLKERADSNQETLQKHINQLEQELAQCRATASLSIADREDVIKDMKAQLNCLSLSFDSAQKQIKTLKEHICCISSCAS